MKICPRQIKGLKTDSIEVEGGVMKCVSVRKQEVVRKDYMGRIMNDENDRIPYVEG